MEIKVGTLSGRLAGPKVNGILIAIFILVNILLLGVICIFGAIEWKSIYLQFVGVTGDGVVIDFKSSGGTRQSTAPVIEINVDGQSYTFDGSYSRPQPLDLGDHLEVIYDPENPFTAQINTYQERWDLLVKVGGGIFPALLLTDSVLILVFFSRKISSTKTDVTI